MKRIPLSSTSLRSVGYNPRKHVLEIEFIIGGTYQYYSVAQSVYRELIAAESHGQFFNEHIKDIYTYKQVQ